MNLLLIIGRIIIAVESCLMYVYLHRKTHISLRYLYKDNLIVIAIVYAIGYMLNGWLTAWSILIAIGLVPVVGLLLTMIRFFRFPLRKPVKNEDAIVSPADGNIIYIKKIEKGDVPMSTKEGVTATLNEFSNVELQYPCWIIGINMTPFDVHRNATPIAGQIVMNKHFDGKFLSLKDPNAMAQNERNTIVIDNGKYQVGVVQTASKLVKRIVTYKNAGDTVEQCEWFGMIKFGSQVDVIIPCDYEIAVELKQQVYTRKTILATLKKQ